jgi:hypothetical protein
MQFKPTPCPLPKGKGIEVHWNKWNRLKIPNILVNQVK